MTAPIWAPGILAFFLQENLHAHKSPRFRGGGGYLEFFFFFGGGVLILFPWARGFS